jgi:hypothetical protein
MPEWSTSDLSRPIRYSLRDNNNAVSECTSAQLTSTPMASTMKSSSLSYLQRIATYNELHHNRDVVVGRKSSASSPAAVSLTSSTNDDADVVVVQTLALQMYHLPGNSWCGDWCMYMRNNHPVFGICCHDRVHPIGSCQRVIALVGTVLFGLAVTNLFYLFYLWNPRFDQVVARFVTQDGDVWTLTTGMLLLWTVGSSIHCAFNLTIWHIAACACCQPGGCCPSRYACCPSLGKHVSRVLIVCILACTVLIVLLRVAITSEVSSNDRESITTYDSNENNDDKKVHIDIDDGLVLDVESVSDFQFVAAYLIEMMLSLFVYYPIGGTILFSGILSCGCKIPLLGGRPYEVAIEQRRAKNKNNNDKSSSHSSTPTSSRSGKGRMTSASLSSLPPKYEGSTTCGSYVSSYNQPNDIEANRSAA